MNMWLIQLGELLPIDGEVRLFRYGILAEMLAEQQHTVTYWGSTFAHALKKHRYLADTVVDINPNYRIRLLFAEGYNRNISLARIKFHQQVANAFSRNLQNEMPPDIILSCMPTPEMCRVAVDYARQHNIPIVIDVCDLWPDIYLTVLPKNLHWLAKTALWPLYRINQRIFRESTAITGVSSGYLEWGLAFAGRQHSTMDRVFPLAYPKLALTQSDYERARQQLLDVGVDPNRFICCFVGAFEASYDLETVIAAAKVFHEQGNPHVQFVLGGDGSKITILKRQATNLNNVVFLGRISPSLIKVLLTMSSVGLVAYTKKALQSIPNKPIEYFSEGLPVISSLRGEFDELVATNKCGISYKPGNVMSLVDAILQLHRDSEKRQEMSNNAFRLYQDHFSSERVYADMIDYLGRMVKNSQFDRLHTSCTESNNCAQ